MPKTPFKEWMYPNEFQDPFFTTFEGLMGQMDASHHAVETYERSIPGGGGTISWTSGGGVGWTANFVVPIFSSGFKVSIEFGPDDTTMTAVLNDGEVLYAEVPVALSQNVTVNFDKASTVPKTDRIYTFAWRDGNTLRLKDGRTFTF